MSGSTSTVTRRQIRRALGPETLGLVEGLTHLITHQLSPALAAHTDTLTQYSRELDRHDRQLCAAFERLDRLEADAKAVQAMGFWDRLRWTLKALG